MGLGESNKKNSHSLNKKKNKKDLKRKDNTNDNKSSNDGYDKKDYSNKENPIFDFSGVKEDKNNGLKNNGNNLDNHLADDIKGANQSDCEVLIEKYKKEALEYLQGWQRCKADYNNLKKEQELLYKRINKAVLKEMVEKLLTILICFKAASEHVPPEEKDKEWVKGIFQLQKMFKDFLGDYGIKEIETIGCEFNPVYHQAIGNDEDSNYASGIIIKEVSPGYILDDEVLIAAKVIVNK